MGTIRGHRYGVYMANRTRILSWNVNGIRAALRKGFGQFIEDLSPDIVMLQEVRALPEQIPAPWVQPEGWMSLASCGERYSGATTYRAPLETMGTDGSGDPEGRLLHTKSTGFHDKPLPLRVSVVRNAKEKEVDGDLPWSEGLVQSSEPVILAGDFNIAHTEDDISRAE